MSVIRKRSFLNGSYAGELHPSKGPRETTRQVCPMRLLVSRWIWLQSTLSLLNACQQPVVGSNPTGGVAGEVKIFGLRLKGCALLLEMVASGCKRHVWEVAFP
jgi:hypothetical protein